MKKNSFTVFLYISIIINLLLSSCSKYNLFSETETPYHFSILKTVNDTINDYPEYALSLLGEIDEQIINNDFTPQEYYEYQILLSEAEYKSYYPQSNYDKILEAKNFFDSLSLLYPKNTEVLYQCARSNYYKAVGEEEKEEVKEAFNCYLKALSNIDNIKTNRVNEKYREEIFHFKALIYTRMGDILYWHDVYKEAIECITNANELFALENNKNSLSRNNIIIAIIYGLNNEHNNALKHLSIADSILGNDEIDVTLRNDIERIKASVMYNIGYKDEAFKSILNQYNTLDNQKQIIEAAGVLGDMYYDKKIYDSAIYYYEKYFPDNKYSKINAANNIIEICIKTGNNELIAKYAPSLAKETNKEILLSGIKTELTSLYLKYNIEKQNKSFSDKLFKHLVLLLVFIIVFYIFGLNYIKLKKKKYNKEILDKKEYINSLQEKINKTSSENKYIKSKIKNLENEIYDIKKRNTEDFIPFEKRIEAIKDAPIYRKLYNISIDHSIKTNTEYPDLQLNDSEQREIIELFNKTLDNNLSRIISEHSNLKYYDMLYFCLYVIGFDEKHISAVTGKSYNTIWNRTKKIQEILSSKKNLKEILKDKFYQYTNY